MRPVALALLLAGVAGSFSFRSAGPEDLHSIQDAYRWYGEFGLAVADSAGTLVVRWMTQEEDSGFLGAFSGTREAYSVRTPPARAHRAAFRRPRGKTVTLEYGGTAGRRDTTVVTLAQPERPRALVSGADSVFVVGDVHGKYNSLVRLLSLAGVTDSANHWIAGGARLVFVGDMVDRGEDATAVLWFIYRLEHEARAAGGDVHVVLGNHEIMEWVGDRRYLAPRESLLAEQYGTCYACLYDPRSSILGRWLASKPGIIQINDVVYVHGGVTPGYAAMGLSGFNQALHRYIREPIFPFLLDDSVAATRFGADQHQRRAAFFFQPDSPFWFRGYVQTDTLGAQLDSVLQRYGASTQVVGHTPVLEIIPLYGGKVIPVNVADFATQLVLFTYSTSGKRRSTRIGLGMERESW